MKLKDKIYLLLMMALNGLCGYCFAMWVVSR